MRVRCAEDTKSCVLIRDSRGGLELGEKEIVGDGGGLAHSESILEGSRLPRILQSGKEDFMSEGA